MLLHCALFVASLLVVIHVIIGGLRRRGLNLPPGPRPWPIIGNLLGIISPHPLLAIDALSKRHGPLMQIYFGSHPVVVASSVDTAKEILKTQDHNFAYRPDTAAARCTTHGGSSVIWQPDGPYLRQARRILQSELFSASRLDSLRHIRSQELRSLVRGLAEAEVRGSPVRLKDLLVAQSLNVVSRMVVGRSFMGGEGAGGYREMLDELFFLNGIFNVSDYFPWVGFMDFQGYGRRMRKVMGRLDAFLEGEIERHRERRRVEGQRFVAADAMDVLLQLQLLDEEDHGLELEVKITKDSVKGFAQDLLAGGTENIAMTIVWAISELLKHPHMFLKATKELDKIIGKDRWVEEEDIPNLHYINGITKETMRLHPMTPLLTPRAAKEHCTINGYDILAGSLVLVSTWSIGRDPDIWDDPAEFNPERFLENPIDVKGGYYQLLPFGTGRRMCPGYVLGWKMLQVTLANLLHGFNWQLRDGLNIEDLSMEGVFGIPEPGKMLLEVLVETRMSKKLYGI